MEQQIESLLVQVNGKTVIDARVPETKEVVEVQPPCTLFNHACAPLLTHLGIDSIPVPWLERFFFAMSLLSRALIRNGELFLPAPVGHGVNGPFNDAESLHRYLTDNQERDSFDISEDEVAECRAIAALAVWIAVCVLSPLKPFQEDFLKGIRQFRGMPND